MLQIQMPQIHKLLTAALLCAALTLTPAFEPSAIAQSAHPLEFEVATIKPSSNGSTGTDIDPDGIVKLNNLSLKGLVEVAFNASYWQIAGGEPWMQKNVFDVVGEPPDAFRQSLPDTSHTWYTITDPRLREMLQTLLIQRFQLKIHRTTQIGKVYFLERTSQPLALHPTKAAASDPSSPQSSYGEISFSGVSGSGDSQLGAWFLFNATMPQLANFASSNLLHRPVLDHTGLTGSFDYRSIPTEWNSDRTFSFMDFLKEVGLKLTPSTGPAEILTIDHAELPSPN